MKCMQPNVSTPVDFEGEALNVMIGRDGKVWVCIDGASVFRARGLSTITIDDHRDVEKGSEDDNGG